MFQLLRISLLISLGETEESSDLNSASKSSLHCFRFYLQVFWILGTSTVSFTSSFFYFFPQQENLDLLFCLSFVIFNKFNSLFF